MELVKKLFNASLIALTLLSANNLSAGKPKPNPAATRRAAEIKESLTQNSPTTPKEQHRNSKSRNRSSSPRRILVSNELPETLDADTLGKYLLTMAKKIKNKETVSQDPITQLFRFLSEGNISTVSNIQIILTNFLTEVADVEDAQNSETEIGKLCVQIRTILTTLENAPAETPARAFVTTIPAEEIIDMEDVDGSKAPTITTPQRGLLGNAWDWVCSGVSSFWNNHKGKIIVVTVVIGTAIIGYFTYQHFSATPTDESASIIEQLRKQLAEQEAARLLAEQARKAAAEKATRELAAETLRRTQAEAARRLAEETLATTQTGLTQCTQSLEEARSLTCPPITDCAPCPTGPDCPSCPGILEQLASGFLSLTDFN
jgi:hypothetical protein